MSNLTQGKGPEDRRGNRNHLYIIPDCGHIGDNPHNPQEISGDWVRVKGRPPRYSGELVEVEAVIKGPWGRRRSLLLDQAIAAHDATMPPRRRRRRGVV